MMEDREQGVTTADLSGALDDEQHEDVTEVQTQEGARQGETAAEPLLPVEDGEAFQSRWQDIQVRFVDEPQER